MKSPRRVALSVPAVLSFAVLLPLAAAASVPTERTGPIRPAAATGEAGYDALPDLPPGAAESGADGVRRSAIDLAASLRAVPVAEGSTEPCPEHRLTVWWDEPGPSYGHGAFVEPLGPAPTAETTSVNGVVTCAGSDWAFMGFEAEYVDGRWNVFAVPYVDEEVGHHGEHGTDHGHDEGATDGHDGHDGHRHEGSHGGGSAPAVSPPPAAGIGRSTYGSAIDGYARYEPQRTCDPTAKPGTVAMKRLLMGGAPGSRNLGIGRACHIGGSSEHKEGRAFDWGVLVHRPAEKASADAFLAQLLATDEAGNRHALARRMGVMYVIWNRQIWSAYRPNDGWRPYSGRSPHTDHVHISLSWDGAMGRTSFWSGQAMEGLSFAGSPTRHGPSGSAGEPGPGPAPTTTQAPTAAPAADDAGEGAARAAQEARKAAEHAAWREQEEAEEEARRRQEAAEEEARRRQRAAADEARRQQKAAEEERRRQEHTAREADRRAREAASAQAPPSDAPARAAGDGRGEAMREGGDKGRPEGAGGPGGPGGPGGNGKGKGKGPGR